MKKLLSVLLLFILILVSQAQSKTEKVITGRVLLDDGQPAAGAWVGAYPVGVRGGLQSATCDEAGSFILALAAAGSYSLESSVPGFVLDSSRAGGNVYRTGQSVTLRLIKGGVITGRVTDITGEPLVGIGISLYRVRDADGNPLNKASAAPTDAQTDDRGIYRAFGLQPGAYLIGAEISEGDDASGRNVPTWYPSTTRDTASEVAVRAGEEISNIDIRHRGDAGHAVSGTVTGDVDFSPPFGGTSVTLVSATTKEPIAGASTNDSRGFALFGISDGEYELHTKAYGEGGYAAASPLRRVTVKGADVTGIELKLVKFGSLAGRVMIERSPPGSAAKCESKNQIEEILLRARGEGRNPLSLNAMTSVDRNSETSAPDPKGDFILKGLEADGYRLEADLPGDAWYIRSITQLVAGSARKADAARSPINLKSGEKLGGVEVTINEGAASLSGRVIAAQEGQKLPPRLMVHLIPAEAAAAEDVLRYREVELGQRVGFEFKHLAPGKYWLLARPGAGIEASDEKRRPAAFDPVQRAQLRREAEVAKNEVELKPCSRVKDATLRF